ncbi:MAG: tetratricopeptide repeat protein [candidate division Zixibacteria bacterium]|nr:tetratricopeptide repeat protein [candidate division Zixibacteria bacterium]
MLKTIDRRLALDCGLVLIVLAGYVVAALFPVGRVWGFNMWGFIGHVVPISISALALIASITTYLVFGRSTTVELNANDTTTSQRSFIWFHICLVIGGICAFWFLREQTHFIGDGYQILSHLINEDPFLKNTELGEAWLHACFKSLLGTTRQAALLSYQVVSVVAGGLFLVGVPLFACHLFQGTVNRILFSLGLASGGFVFLFFGHVENYSLLVLSVTVFTLTGVLAGRGLCHPRWALITALITVVFHVIGIALVPAALYLLLRKTWLADWWSRLHIKWQVISVLIVLKIMILTFIYLYLNNYYFRYAFVPIIPIEVTAAGYTLFSKAHIIDYFNLLVFLLPGLPLVVGVSFFLPVRKIIREPQFRFLAILTATCLFVVFVLEPRLGMPRDRDLFAFAGVPLVVVGYLLLLDNRILIRGSKWTAMLCIILSLVGLSAHVMVYRSPGLAIKHLMNYVELDLAKNRATSQVLVDYYRRTGDIIGEYAELRRHKQNYPETQLGSQAVGLVDQKRYGEALRLNEKAIAINPTYWPAYSNMGQCLIEMQRYDTALQILQIADGLNPHNPTIIHNLGYAWLWMGERDKAETAFLRATDLDSQMVEPLSYLVRLYQEDGRQAECQAVLEKMVLLPDIPSEILKDLIDIFLARQSYENAATILQQIANLREDSAYVAEILTSHPQLSEYFQIR